MVEWNDTTMTLINVSAEQFEAQVETNTRCCALVLKIDLPTTLNQRANQLAHYRRRLLAEASHQRCVRIAGAGKGFA